MSSPRHVFFTSKFRISDYLVVLYGTVFAGKFLFSAPSSSGKLVAPGKIVGLNNNAGCVIVRQRWFGGTDDAQKFLCIWLVASIVIGTWAPQKSWIFYNTKTTLVNNGTLCFLAAATEMYPPKFEECFHY